MAFPRGPGGFSELREAGRNHFNLLVPILARDNELWLETLRVVNFFFRVWEQIGHILHHPALSAGAFQKQGGMFETSLRETVETQMCWRRGEIYSY